MPPLNNLVNFFGKNSNFCDLKDDYTFRFLKKFETKYRKCLV